MTQEGTDMPVMLQEDQELGLQGRHMVRGVQGLPEGHAR